MKLLYVTLVLALCLGSVNAQTFNEHLPKLKQLSANQFGIPVGSISKIEVRTFGNQHFAVVKFNEEGNSVTGANEFAIRPNGPAFIGNFTIKCVGVGCAECDIAGLPDPRNVHCLCVRPTTEGGYCNMEKSVTIGY